MDGSNRLLTLFPAPHLLPWGSEKSHCMISILLNLQGPVLRLKIWSFSKYSMCTWKRMCILLLLGGLFYKCQLCQLIVFTSLISYIFSLLVLSVIETSVNIFKCNGGFIYFVFYQFFPAFIFYDSTCLHHWFLKLAIPSLFICNYLRVLNYIFNLL